MSQAKQTLWERISQVAEQTKDIPAWKRGSAVNQRLSCSENKNIRTFSTTALVER